MIRSIVKFTCGDAPSKAPDSSRALARDGFSDALGVMVAGTVMPVARNLLAWIRSRRGPGEARVWLSAEHASVAHAALVGTAAAHALDYDDYAYSNHVSAVLVPPILAEAERQGADGSSMVKAYLVGFEVWGALFKAEPDHLHSKGWHPTGVFGPLGVAAALCHLRGVDESVCTSALGLAAASGGGVMDNFGFQAKPWQGARAAEAGVTAVELACAGLDAGPDAVDGSGGLLAALSPEGRVKRKDPLPGLGSAWLSAGPALNLKCHPTVGASQRAIDAAIELHGRDDFQLGQVDTVTARVSEKHAAVMRLHRPLTASEARFSLEFCVAAGLLVGRVGLRELSDEFVGREDVQALLRRVRIETGPDDDPSYPVGARYDTVRVRLKDGRTLESDRVYRFRGHGDNPLSEDELEHKFLECCVPVLGESPSLALWRAVRRLDELESTEAFPVLNYRTLARPSSVSSTPATASRD